MIPESIIIATHNQSKVLEIKDILSNISIKTISLEEVNWYNQPTESGCSYYENALMKAKPVIDFFGRPTLAEDSGIEVDALGSQPGIYSARYAGERASDSDNNQKLLIALKGIPSYKRTARYRCVLVLMFPDGKVYSWEGTCQGIITLEPKGNSGFGYDPIFLIPQYGKTFAELGDIIKNRISHRAKALEEFRNFIQNFY